MVLYDVGWAIQKMREGASVRRTFWKNVDYIFIDHDVYAGGVAMEPAVFAYHGGRVTPWLASQNDLLAVDWQEVES